jgi:hydroxypyruvate reductase
MNHRRGGTPSPLRAEVFASEYLCVIPDISLCAFFHKVPLVPLPGSDSATASPTHHLLRDLYRVATEAVDPGPALAGRLRSLALPTGTEPWIIALGKAATPMAEAAVAVLRERGASPAGGLIVAPRAGAVPDPRLTAVAGDHPEPGPGSFAAAEALGSLVARTVSGSEVWVLLSGGTTSLLGAPEPGITPDELTALYALLLGSGLDITAMNRIRKRFSRWGGGKLARALQGSSVRVYVVSDVIGDDLASIGSGPCVPDPATATEVRQLLETAGLWTRIPAAARALVAATEAGKTPETPKPGDRAFARVSHELIASNRLALEAAARHAAAVGLAPEVAVEPLAGEAAAAGTRLAAFLLQHCGPPDIPQPESGGTPRRCFIWGGETTVTLGSAAPGMGGRCQELALAAARTLDGAPAGVALLAAGTDGRDGPTDAAGAIVDPRTWSAAIAGGRDPERDLLGHDAYRSLDAARALLRPGLTGTNVMDIVVGLC